MRRGIGFLVLVIGVGLSASNCSGKSDGRSGPDQRASGGAAAGSKSSAGGAAATAGSGGSTGGARGGQAGTALGGRSSAAGRGGRMAGGGGGLGGRDGTPGGEAGATGGDTGSGGESAGAGAAAGEAGSGGEPNAFVPSDLGSRLVLWLDAGQGVSASNGDNVDEWLDQSNAHNDAFQAMAASQPVYTSAGINGLPAMTFDGGATFFEVADGATLHFGTGPFAVFAIARGAPATGVNAMIFQKTNPNDPWAGPELVVNTNNPTDSAKVAMQLDGNTFVRSSVDVDDTKPRLFAGRRFEGPSGTELELRLDGASESQMVLAAAVNIDAPGRNAIIGHNGYLPNSGFQAYAGEVAEICAVKGALSTGELASLERYLLDKYGLR